MACQIEDSQHLTSEIMLHKPNQKKVVGKGEKEGYRCLSLWRDGVVHDIAVADVLISNNVN